MSVLFLSACQASPNLARCESREPGTSSALRDALIRDGLELWQQVVAYECSEIIHVEQLGESMPKAANPGKVLAFAKCRVIAPVFGTLKAGDEFFIHLRAVPPAAQAALARGSAQYLSFFVPNNFVDWFASEQTKGVIAEVMAPAPIFDLRGPVGIFGAQGVREVYDSGAIHDEHELFPRSNIAQSLEDYTQVMADLLPRLVIRALPGAGGGWKVEVTRDSLTVTRQGETGEGTRHLKQASDRFLYLLAAVVRQESDEDLVPQRAPDTGVLVFRFYAENRMRFFRVSMDKATRAKLLERKQQGEYGPFFEALHESGLLELDLPGLSIFHE